MAAIASAFWDFSLRLYAQPEIAAACLQLQDNHGVNVNLLLWCCWLEQQHILLTAERLQRAHQRVDNWEQDYVVPLRMLRRKLKQQFGTTDAVLETLRQSMKQAELLAEKQMQTWLAMLAHDWPAENDFPAGRDINIHTYLTSLQLPDTNVSTTLAIFNNNHC